MTNFTNFCLSRFFRFIGRRFFATQVTDAIRIIQLQKFSHRKYAALELGELILALVMAEDRRFFQHCGVDLRGIFRAVVVYISKRSVQGASTITQQLVRVVINDYRFSFQRKLKEICIAVEVDSIISKKTQAELYLMLGYYGWRMNGLASARERLTISFPCTTEEAAQIVARLKYPEPERSSTTQTKKINGRAAHICNLIGAHRHEK